MDTPVEEQHLFQHVTCHIAATEDEITVPGALSSETIAQVNNCLVFCCWGSCASSLTSGI